MMNPLFSLEAGSPLAAFHAWHDATVVDGARVAGVGDVEKPVVLDVSPADHDACVVYSEEMVISDDDLADGIDPQETAGGGADVGEGGTPPPPFCSLLDALRHRIISVTNVLKGDESCYVGSVSL